MNLNTLQKQCGRTPALLLATLAWAVMARAGESGTDTHPALERYPSPAQLEERILAMKSNSPAAFATARRDFDLGIRSVFLLEPPKLPDYVTPHGAQEVRLAGLAVGQGLDLSIERLGNKEGGAPVAQFYREHYDDYQIDDSPALRLVLADVVMHGWDDWADWSDPKLTEVRAQFPELHRAYALQLARYFEVADLNGLALRVLIDPEGPVYVRQRAGSALKYVDNNVDVLDFVVKHAAGATDSGLRPSLNACIQPISQDIEPRERRAFWVDYLESPNDHLRWIAVVETDSAIEAIRAMSKGQDMSPDLYARLKEIAGSDPNDKIRMLAARAVQRREPDLFRNVVPGGRGTKAAND